MNKSLILILCFVFCFSGAAFAYGINSYGPDNARSVRERQYENQKRDLQRQQQQVRQLQYQQNEMQRIQKNYNYNDRRGEGITGVTPLR